MSATATTSNLVRRTGAAVVAGLLLTVGAASPGQTAGSEAIVIGSGPTAVFVGPAPTYGGDPARGETDGSYVARTGRHLPGLSTAIEVDGPWWYGRAPVTGGDPASGETDESYVARTGRHLPGQ